MINGVSYLKGCCEQRAVLAAWGPLSDPSMFSLGLFSRIQECLTGLSKLSSSVLSPTSLEFLRQMFLRQMFSRQAAVLSAGMACHCCEPVSPARLWWVGNVGLFFGFLPPHSSPHSEDTLCRCLIFSVTYHRLSVGTISDSPSRPILGMTLT